jgi:hypothetical protein
VCEKQKNKKTKTKNDQSEFRKGKVANKARGKKSAGLKEVTGNEITRERKGYCK